MIQRHEWTPLSQPGLCFVTEWDDSFEDAPHRCISATRDGAMLWPPQAHYEMAVREEELWREANIVRSEKIEKQDSVTRVHFDISRIDGASKFKDALYFPDGEMPTENEIKAIQDKRYAAWQAAIAYSGREIVTGEVWEIPEAEMLRLAKEPVEQAVIEKPVEEAVESAVDG